MKFKIFTAIIISSLAMQSCATIFTGSKQSIQIGSIPAGAKIQVDGIDRGTTPSVVKLKKGFDGQMVTLKKEGYETKTFQPETTFNPVSVLNLFGILGWAIDAASGAMMKYDPTSYEINLDSSPKAETTK